MVWCGRSVIRSWLWFQRAMSRSAFGVRVMMFPSLGRLCWGNCLTPATSPDRIRLWSQISSFLTGCIRSELVPRLRRGRRSLKARYVHRDGANEQRCRTANSSQSPAGVECRHPSASSVPEDFGGHDCGVRSCRRSPRRRQAPLEGDEVACLEDDVPAEEFRLRPLAATVSARS